MRFYSDANLALGAEVRLSDAASAHAVRVLRMTEGDVATLFNGDGYDYESVLVSVKKSAVIAKVKQQKLVENESPLNIVLLQGISSGDRMDYTIQKAVELGVRAIQPITTVRSVVKLNQARAQKRLQHWQAVVHAACEQSARAFVPQVAAPKTLDQWLANHPNEGVSRFLLNPVGAMRFAEMAKPDNAIQLLIGAEGGLTESEIALATANGFQSVILGTRILRTETAALAAIASMQSIWGDF